MFLLHPLQEVAAISIMGVVDVFLQQVTQVQREPAESEDQHQAEDGLRHLSTLLRENQLSG